MTSKWQQAIVSDFIEFNPKVSLKKGTLAKKISMEKILPFNKNITGYEWSEFSGGTKFENGDTLLARITPCLENGKTSLVNNLEKGEKAFGSTEFIVMRAIKEISDPQYVYYLAISPFFRDYAIKSMAGTSGRQRVQVDLLKNLSILLPPLEEQKRIGEFLSEIDEKINCNQQINDNLENQIKTLFKKIFISNNSINWKKGTFSDLIIDIISGDWGKETPTEKYNKKVYCIRGADIPTLNQGYIGNMPTRYVQIKSYQKKQVVPNDIIVEISGGSPTQSTGRASYMSNTVVKQHENAILCTNFCKVLRPFEEYGLFMYYYWLYLYDLGVFFSYENGTTGIKNLDIKGFISDFTIKIPPIKTIKYFNDICTPLLEHVYSNGIQKDVLENVRDRLLPKLMSGEIDVSSIKL